MYLNKILINKFIYNLYFVSVTKTPLNTKPVKNGRKNIKDIITSMISSNCSMTLKDSPIVPQTIACTGMTRR